MVKLSYTTQQEDRCKTLEQFCKTKKNHKNNSSVQSMKVFGTTLISGFIHRCNSISSNGMMSSAPAACRGNKKQVLSACRAAQTFVWGGFQRSNPPPLLQIKLAPLYLKGPDIEDALRRPSAKEEQVQELCRHLGAALGCSKCGHPQHPHAMRMHATSACACSH